MRLLHSISQAEDALTGGAMHRFDSKSRQIQNSMEPGANACACGIAMLIVACGRDITPASTDPGAVAGQHAAQFVAQMKTTEKRQRVHGTAMPIPDYDISPAEALSGSSYIPGIPQPDVPATSRVDSAAGSNSTRRV
jgi:hypothetical protein